MLQIALLLCGRQFISRNRIILTMTGVLWGLFGTVVLIDGMLGAQYFPLRLFGYILLFESLTILIVSSATTGAKRGIYLFRGGITGGASLLILSGIQASNLMLAIVFGFVCFLSGTLVIAAAWIVRYVNWRRAIAGGMCQILYAIFLFQPYPTHHDGTVPQFMGMLMLLSAVECLRLSVRLRQMAPGITIFDVQSADAAGAIDGNSVVSHAEVEDRNGRCAVLRVLIWTPEKSAYGQTVRRPIVNRYIAAVDTEGVISTGHAALEMEDLYISLYPASDIDRSPSEFFRTLRAVRENDVPGRFIRDYATESRDWCEADRQVCFTAFSEASLRAFDAMYRQGEVYNLTRRNCSSSVAWALEAALDGVLHRKDGWTTFLSLLVRPELWVAAQLRRRATTMAWTPGLVLDYARALHALVHPAPYNWRPVVKAPSQSAE